MIYKFKSQIAAELVMLQPNAEELLKIIGKSPGPTGIITVAQCGPAVAALRAEMERREAQGSTTPPGNNDDPTDADRQESVTLRRRAGPFIDLLERSSAAGKDVVWGV